MIVQPCKTPSGRARYICEGVYGNVAFSVTGYTHMYAINNALRIINPTFETIK